MRVAVVHGYFLGDSGSAIYARELAREFTRQGHDVTLVCQDQSPERYDFIDRLFVFGPDNDEPRLVFDRKPVHDGRCRLVRPFIGNRLLTYVAGPFPPFEVVPLQDASDEMITAYLETNIKSMSAIFRRWPQDLVQANHAIMQPHIVREALSGEAIQSVLGPSPRLSPDAVRESLPETAPYIVTIHGSELNFTVRKDPRLVPYMKSGLEGATAIAALSETSRDEVIGLAIDKGFDIESKTVVLPPGVDTNLFKPHVKGSAKTRENPWRDQRSPALRELSSSLDLERDNIAVFAGRLLWTKGLQYAVAALPLVLAKCPRLQLVIVGDGPMRPGLEKFIEALGCGDIIGAGNLLAKEPELKHVSAYGPVMPELDPEEQESYRAVARNLGNRIHFTGHRPHEQLAPLFAAADISLAPSVFPEAFGLVSIEALAAGALPVATYQTGLRTPLDVIADSLDDPSFKLLAPGIGLTRRLASSVTSILDKYPTRDQDFRKKLHGIARLHFSWEIVARRYLELSSIILPPRDRDRPGAAPA
ncbi:MAG: glycosyltransferase family 4 protein [Thermoleophilia bacterium]